VSNFLGTHFKSVSVLDSPASVREDKRIDAGASLREVYKEMLIATPALGYRRLYI
jgi:hypothetical protein